MSSREEDVLYPPYTPPASLGRELGIMFGFLGATLFLIAMYWVIWQFLQHRSAAKDAARRAHLRARGFHESMLENYFEQRFGHSSWSTMPAAPRLEPTALQRARLTTDFNPLGSNPRTPPQSRIQWRSRLGSVGSGSTQHPLSSMISSTTDDTLVASLNRGSFDDKGSHYTTPHSAHTSITRPPPKDPESMKLDRMINDIL